MRAAASGGVSQEAASQCRSSFPQKLEHILKTPFLLSIHRQLSSAGRQIFSSVTWDSGPFFSAQFVRAAIAVLPFAAVHHRRLRRRRRDGQAAARVLIRRRRDACPPPPPTPLMYWEGAKFQGRISSSATSAAILYRVGPTVAETAR